MFYNGLTIGIIIGAVTGILFTLAFILLFWGNREEELEAKLSESELEAAAAQAIKFTKRRKAKWIYKPFGISWKIRKGSETNYKKK